LSDISHIESPDEYKQEEFSTEIRIEAFSCWHKLLLICLLWKSLYVPTETD
jgi:hypothetical protein